MPPTTVNTAELHLQAAVKRLQQAVGPARAAALITALVEQIRAQKEGFTNHANTQQPTD